MHHSLTLKYHFLKRISPSQVFMLSSLIVSGGNYAYNLLLGRFLGPEKFADAAIMITFLIVLSFIAMTVQLATAKFRVLLEGEELKQFMQFIYSVSLGLGVLLGGVVMSMSGFLQEWLNTSTESMFLIFSFGIPLYFVMSVNRGSFQGGEQLYKLSGTYLLEMLSRLVITIALIFISSIQHSNVVSIGVLLSLVCALFPFDRSLFSLRIKPILKNSILRSLGAFILITGLYELTQIIINNSDIILVKYFFSSYEAGLYASIALVGRIIYFVTWMFVMLLLPTVVKLKKEGQRTTPILMKYVSYTLVIAFSIVLVTFLFPEIIIELLFGEAYLPYADLLWKYALATSFFAVSNIFAYYFLSIEIYSPIAISAFFGVLQILLVIVYHDSILQVIYMQILAMSLLFVVQLSYFLNKEFNTKTKI